MQDLIIAIFDQLEEHWAKFAVAAAFMLVGWFFGRRKERHNWEKREFLDRLNVSLNSLVDGTLRIRTVLEKPAEEVFLNKVATTRLLQYAAQTVPGQPIIPIPDHDRWYYLNAVLNEVSEHFSGGLLHADNDLPSIHARYVACLTREANGGINTQKLRAMLIRKDLLLNLPAEKPKFESPKHETRWETLHHLAEQYRADANSFVEIEIVLPTPHATPQQQATLLKTASPPNRDGNNAVESSTNPVPAS